jgi:hypothetical protein
MNMKGEKTGAHMAERIWFQQEVPCNLREQGALCNFTVDGTLRELQTEFDGLVCDVDLEQGHSLESAKFVISCSGRPNAKYQEALAPALLLREFAGKLFMTVITSIVDGALRLIGAL